MLVFIFLKFQPSHSTDLLRDGVRGGHLRWREPRRAPAEASGRTRDSAAFPKERSHRRPHKNLRRGAGLGSPYGPRADASACSVLYVRGDTEAAGDTRGAQRLQCCDGGKNCVDLCNYK